MERPALPGKALLGEDHGMEILGASRKERRGLTRYGWGDTARIEDWQGWARQGWPGQDWLGSARIGKDRS